MQDAAGEESAAAAACAGDDKPFSGPVVDVVDPLVHGVRFDGGIDQNIDAAVINCFFIVFWLIQSQSQSGTASAKAFKYYPQGSPRIVLKNFQELRFRFFRDGHQQLHSVRFVYEYN